MKQIGYYRRKFTSPGQTGDAFCCNSPGVTYIFRECLFDLSAWPLDKIDEAASIVQGANARYKRCVFRGAGKLVLLGTGDPEDRPMERKTWATFRHCLFENFSRRGPEVQSSMYAGLHKCVIRNWGEPSRFDTRSFGAWAHDGGRLVMQSCVFDQPRFWRGWRQMLADMIASVGQAWNDECLRGLLRPSTYLPGVCRAAFATAGGRVTVSNSRGLKWWIRFPSRWSRMPRNEAVALVAEIEKMAAEVERLAEEMP